MKDDDLEHLFYFLSRDLRFCGCGDPESAYELVRDVLEIFRESTEWMRTPRENPFSIATLSSAPPYREMIKERIGGGDGTYYAVLYWLDSSGVLEHGGSVGGSWLTEKGFHYLSLMKAHEYRELEGPGGIVYGLPHDGGECGPGCRHWEASYSEYEKKAMIKARERNE